MMIEDMAKVKGLYMDEIAERDAMIQEMADRLSDAALCILGCTTFMPESQAEVANKHVASIEQFLAKLEDGELSAKRSDHGR